MPELHMEFAKKQGCDQKELTDIIKCLQDKPASELMKGLQMFDECNSKNIKMLT